LKTEEHIQKLYQIYDYNVGLNLNKNYYGFFEIVFASKSV